MLLIYLFWQVLLKPMTKGFFCPIVVSAVQKSFYLVHDGLMKVVWPTKGERGYVFILVELFSDRQFNAVLAFCDEKGKVRHVEI